MRTRVLFASIAVAATALTVGPLAVTAATPALAASSSFNTPHPPPAPKAPAAPAKPAAPAPAKAGSGQQRTSNLPKNTGANVNGPARTSRVPVNTGSLVTSGRATAVSTGRVSISSTARASGSSYKVPSTSVVYQYESADYWTSHALPRRGTSAYFVVLNDPYYFGNYGDPLSPWYNHAYPVGYVVSNGEFVPAPSHIGEIIGLIVGIVVLLIVLFVVVPRLMSRRPKPYGRGWLSLAPANTGPRRTLVPGGHTLL